MSLRNFWLVLALVDSLSVCGFVIAVGRRNTRTQYILGLIGSISLQLGAVCGTLRSNILAVILLEIVGASFLFANSILAIKRRYS